MHSFLTNDKKAGESGTITPEDGEKMAIRINAFKYIECSAKESIGVMDVFQTAALAALSIQPKKSCFCSLL